MTKDQETNSKENRIMRSQNMYKVDKEISTLSWKVKWLFSQNNSNIERCQGSILGSCRFWANKRFYRFKQNLTLCFSHWANRYLTQIWLNTLSTFMLTSGRKSLCLSLSSTLLLLTINTSFYSSCMKRITKLAIKFTKKVIKSQILCF